MATVTSMAQLEKLINLKVKKAVQMTRDNIYEMINFHLIKYYGDYSPELYERTYRMADSLIKLDVDVSGTSISAEVKIDEGYLNSGYPTGTWTGRDVVASAQNGLHGGRVHGDTAFWVNAIDELGGKSGIKALLISNLRACGL